MDTYLRFGLIAAMACGGAPPPQAVEAVQTPAVEQAHSELEHLLRVVPSRTELVLRVNVEALRASSVDQLYPGLRERLEPLTEGMQTVTAALIDDNTVLGLISGLELAEIRRRWENIGATFEPTDIGGHPVLLSGDFSLAERQPQQVWAGTENAIRHLFETDPDAGSGPIEAVAGAFRHEDALFQAGVLATNRDAQNVFEGVEGLTGGTVELLADRVILRGLMSDETAAQRVVEQVRDFQRRIATVVADLGAETGERSQVLPLVGEVEVRLEGASVALELGYDEARLNAIRDAEQSDRSVSAQVIFGVWRETIRSPNAL